MEKENQEPKKEIKAEETKKEESASEKPQAPVASKDVKTAPDKTRMASITTANAFLSPSSNTSP